MMLGIRLVLCFYLISPHEAKLSFENPSKTYFKKCVSDVIKQYFQKCKELSLVDMETENYEIVKIVHDIEVNSIILREPDTRFRTRNDGYFIAAGNYTQFIKNLPNLTSEIYWRPSVRFLIMINGNLTHTALRKVFDLLLSFNVINVLVMDESADPNLYTYNPFENYGCGQHYDRIIEYGKCSVSKQNLYPQKLLTGLRNCTFKVACPHWPPYSIDPTRNNGSMGIEEKLLREIGKLEHFQINISYTNDAETYSMITREVVAIGPLDKLQNRAVQMIAGGMILTHPRAKAFDYIWGHLAYTDEISYLVKKATPVASWKYTYLEFDAIVWTVLIFAFAVYLVIFIVLVRPTDKGRIVLKMFGYLLLAANRVRGSFFTRYLFIHWVFFAYVINVYYVSNLMSFTFNPVNKYQVSDEEALLKYNVRPCVSRVIKDYLASVNVNESIWKNRRKGCDKLLESIHTVAESDDVYTVAIHSIFKYNKFSYIDTWGEKAIYVLKEPLTKTVYAIYLYKGFPMLEKLHLHTLRARENGLVDKYIRDLYWERYRTYHFKSNEQLYHVFVPWYMLVFGYALTVVIFLIEIISSRFPFSNCIICFKSYH